MTIIKTAHDVTYKGMSGKMKDLIIYPPHSTDHTVTKQQVMMFTQYFTENKQLHKIDVELRFDDQCGNGHEDFAITASVYEMESRGYYKGSRDSAFVMGGCCHEEIAKRFPKLAHLIKWHLCGVTGPWGYVANTVYLAGDRDCNGLRKGEVRSWDDAIRWDAIPIKTKISHKFAEFLRERIGRKDFQATGPLEHRDNAKPGSYQYSPHYSLVGFTEDWTYAEFKTQEEAQDFALALNACAWHLTKIPVLYSEGKERELDAARSAAIWPEATDEQLSVDKEQLTKDLMWRLPPLMVEFKQDMIDLGFVYPSEEELASRPEGRAVFNRSK